MYTNRNLLNTQQAEIDSSLRDRARHLTDRVEKLDKQEADLTQRGAHLDLVAQSLRERELRLQQREMSVGAQQHRLQTLLSQAEARHQTLLQREQQTDQWNPQRPTLDQEIGPLLQNATQQLYGETGTQSVKRTRALEKLALQLRRIQPLFSSRDVALLNSVFMVHHPAREDTHYRSTTASFAKFCRDQRQLRGERIAQQRTPGLVASDRPTLVRRNSWSQ